MILYYKDLAWFIAYEEIKQKLIYTESLNNASNEWLTEISFQVIVRETISVVILHMSDWSKW